MFENLSYLALQQYWWVIVSFMGSILTFLLFVQGGQTLIYSIGKTDKERTMVINALGRKWEFTFTAIVVFGGTLFASFPLFYATSFGGAYWLWMIILFCFILQAVSYHYRSKPNNFFGGRIYETFLLLNGFTATFFIGVLTGTFFNGAEFFVNEVNQSHWQLPYGGLEAFTNFHNLTLGFSVFFLSRMVASLYFMNSIKDDNVFEESRKQTLVSMLPFLVVFIYFIAKLFTKEGFAVDPQTSKIFIEDYKYLDNLLRLPLVAAIMLAGIISLLYGVIRSIFGREWTKGVWFAGGGTILTIFSLFIVAGMKNTAFYPSSYDLQSSLTIQNASSSYYTLTTMCYISLVIPFVIWYLTWSWRAINKKKINAAEMEGDHVY